MHNIGLALILQAVWQEEELGLACYIEVASSSSQITKWIMSI